MRFRSIVLLVVVLTFAGIHLIHTAEPEKAVDNDAFKKEIAPLLAKYCTSCHGGDKPKADLAMDVLQG